MFIHSVYFWLRDDLSAAQMRQFDAGLHSLLRIDSVRDGHIGVPASTSRPVIERGYSRALVLLFSDEAAHDAYQSDPVHDRFRDECGALYATIRIFDAITDG